jgi:triacylglycerol lipase
MRQTIIFLILITLFSSCAKEKNNNGNNNNTPTCNADRLPVVMVHGFLASGDTWALQAQRFKSNSYCDDKVYVLDWNTLGGNQNAAIQQLDELIDKILQQTGKTQVELVGHSAGGGVGYSYCSDAARALKVAHYVHVGSNSQSQPAGPNGEIPTLCISSPDDAVTGNTTITGATNVTLAGQDHYQVATSKEAFAEMYKFFNGSSPKYDDVMPDTEIKVSGKVLTLGDNTSLINATVNVYELNASDGSRNSTTPSHTLTTNDNGLFAAFTAKQNTYYEFEVVSANASDRKLFYFREPFKKSDNLVYLRTVPTSGLAATLLGNLPKDDNQTVLAIFAANQAVVNGRDELYVNDNLELSSATISPASATNIAYFLYDDNRNQQTDLTKPFIFNVLTSFLTARDVYFPTQPAGSIKLRFNGRNQFVRNLRSSSDGIVVAVFN